MIRFHQFIKTILLEAKLEHFVHLNLDPENEHHTELLTAFNNNKERLVKKHPTQYKDIGELSNAVSPYIKSPEISGATLVHHNKESGAKVYHVHTDEASCKLGSDTWCTSHDEFDTHDLGRSFIMHFPNEPERRLRKIGSFGDGSYTKGFYSFQDAANKDLSDEDWDHLRNKHNLDQIPELSGLRGIPISNKELQKRDYEFLHKITSGLLPEHHLIHLIYKNRIKNNHIDTIVNHPKLDDLTSILIEHHVDKDITLYPEHINTIVNNTNKPKSQHNLIRFNLINQQQTDHIITNKIKNNRLYTHELSYYIKNNKLSKQHKESILQNKDLEHFHNLLK